MKNNPEKPGRKTVRKAIVKKDTGEIPLSPLQFNDILETLPCYLILLSPDYHVVFANKFFRERFGVSHGKRCFEYLFNRTEPCEVCETYKVLKIRQPLEWEWLGPDGHNYYIYDFPFKIVDGSTLIMEVGIDITLQKEALAALRKLHDELEIRVQERTGELKEVNILLRNKMVEHRDARESAKRIAEEWQATFDSITDMISIQDRDCRLVKVNRAYADAVGISREELVGQKCHYVIHGIDCPVKNCPHEETVATRKPVTREIYEPKLGRHLQVTTSPMYNEDGEVTGSVHIAKDITERVKADEVLRESEEKFRTLNSAMSEGVCLHEMIYDETGKAVDYRILEINPAYEAFTGLTREKAIGEKASELYGTGRPPYFDIYERVAATGKPESFETYFAPMHKNFSIAAFSPGEGRFATVFSDITERKKAEEALEESQRRLERSQELAHLGSWELDLVNDKLTWSDEVYRIFGLKPQEFSATYGAFLDAIHPEDRAAVDTAYTSSIKEGRYHYEIEHRIVRKSTGEIRYVFEKCEHIRDETGKIVKSIGMVHDITDRKKVEHLKDEFIGLVSHELRTPLTVITGSLRTAMSSGISAADLQALIKNASEGADQLASILENMLELSRFQAGRLILHVEPVSIAGTARNVIKKLKDQGMNHRFLTDIPKNLPPVEADPVRVERIIYNLMENAAKYSPPDSRITASARSDGKFVITSIADEGPGIPPEDRPRLFEVFQQLETSKRPASGAGLGLVVCKRLVEAQGGWIKLDSAPGKGSTFSFALPQSQSPL